MSTRCEDFLQKLTRHIEKYMDYGARPCKLCGHHHNHSEDCLYLEAKRLLEELKNE